MSKPGALEVGKFAQRSLRQRRRHLEMSQREVVEKVKREYGIDWWHQTTLSKIESGDRQLLLIEAWALCEVLMMTLDSLIEEKP